MHLHCCLRDCVELPQVLDLFESYLIRKVNKASEAEQVVLSSVAMPESDVSW